MRQFSAVIYDEPFYSSRYSKLNFRVKNMGRVRKDRYSGEVTAGVKKRLGKAVSLLCQGVRPRWIHNPVSGREYLHKLSFITLTIASGVNLSAREAYDMLLSHFLDWLTRTKGVKSFIWKFELQQRGQAHYHLVVPDFIHMHEIQRKWNALQRKAGILKEWFAKHGNYCPPGTHVRGADPGANLEWYVLKELQKTINGRKLYLRRIADSLVKAGELCPRYPTTEEVQRGADAFKKLPIEKVKDAWVKEWLGHEVKTEGRVWGCSLNLSKGKYWSCVLRDAHNDKLEQWQREGLIQVFTRDFVTVIVFTEGEARQLLNEQENKLLDSHVRAILDG